MPANMGMFFTRLMPGSRMDGQTELRSNIGRSDWRLALEAPRRAALIGAQSATLCGIRTVRGFCDDIKDYFFSAGVEVAGPMPDTWIMASSPLAPS
jgi:hypothetical protein